MTHPAEHHECVLEVIRQRRTARAYASGPVPAERLTLILEAARWAPSAANRQPWEFVVVQGDDLKQRLRTAFLDEAAPREASYRAVTAQQADLLLAPVLIGVCGDPGTKARFVNAPSLDDAALEELFLLSMGAAIQNMLLEATALGLGSTWLARPARVPAIWELLGVPPPLRLVALVAVGPAERLPWDEAMRMPIERKIHRDRYRGAGA